MTTILTLSLFATTAFAQDGYCDDKAHEAGFEACPSANTANLGFGVRCDTGCDLISKLEVEVRRCESGVVVGSGSSTNFEQRLVVRLPNLSLTEGACFQGWTRSTWAANGAVGEWQMFRQEYVKNRQSITITKALVFEDEPADPPPTDEFDQWVETVVAGAEGARRIMEEGDRQTDEALAGIALTDEDPPEPEPGLRAPPPLEPAVIPEDDGWGEPTGASDPPTVLTSDDPNPAVRTAGFGQFGGIPLQTIVREPVCEVIVQYAPGVSTPKPEEWEALDQCLQNASTEAGEMANVYVDCEGWTDVLPYSDLKGAHQRDRAEQGGLAAARVDVCKTAADKASVDPNHVRNVGTAVHRPEGQRLTILRAYDGPPEVQVITPDAIADALPPAPQAGPCDWVLETHPVGNGRTVAGDVNQDGAYNAKDCSAAIDERMPEPAAASAAVSIPEQRKPLWGVHGTGGVFTYGWDLAGGLDLFLPFGAGTSGDRWWRIYSDLGVTPGPNFTMGLGQKPVNEWQNGPPVLAWGFGTHPVFNTPVTWLKLALPGVEVRGLRLSTYGDPEAYTLNAFAGIALMPEKDNGFFLMVAPFAGVITGGLRDGETVKQWPSGEVYDDPNGAKRYVQPDLGIMVQGGIRFGGKKSREATPEASAEGETE